MVIGLDIGYGYTKTSFGHCFKSEYSIGKPFLNGIVLEKDGSIYTVGNGVGVADENKINSKLNELCLLTALGLASYQNYHVVTGLPISQYKKQAAELKRNLEKYIGTKYRLNNIDKNITISEAEVFPQGVGALYSHDIKEDVIIVDIGYRTLDIAYIEYNGRYQLVKSGTIYSGMSRLYSDIITEVNSKYDMSCGSSYAEKIILNGLTVNGEKQDTGFLNPVKLNFLSEIENEIITNYLYKVTKICLCGGGAYILYDVLKKRFPHVTMLDNPQFANADGFAILGRR